MKIILFSTEDSMSDVSRLESTSASDFHAFHIRKPNRSKEKLEEYITHLPLDWLSIAVLHSHFDLLNDFNIKGIHLMKRIGARVSMLNIILIFFLLHSTLLKT